MSTKFAVNIHHLCDWALLKRFLRSDVKDQDHTLTVESYWFNINHLSNCSQTVVGKFWL